MGVKYDPVKVRDFLSQIGIARQEGESDESYRARLDAVDDKKIYAMTSNILTELVKANKTDGQLIYFVYALDGRARSLQDICMDLGMAGDAIEIRRKQIIEGLRARLGSN